MNFFKVKLKSKSRFPGADSGTAVPAQGNKKPKIQNPKPNIVGGSTAW